MNDYLQFTPAEGSVFQVPLHHHRIGGPFVGSPFEDSDPPVVSIDEYTANVHFPKEVNVTQVQFHGDTLVDPVRFILESFTFEGGEKGRLILNISHRDYGEPTYDLEYYATERFGEVVRTPAVMQWDHDKGELTSD